MLNDTKGTIVKKPGSKTRDRKMIYLYYKAIIPNINALNSDTHTLRIQYTQKQCVGVAIEGMDIWYLGLIILIIISEEFVESKNHYLF